MTLPFSVSTRAINASFSFRAASKAFVLEEMRWRLNCTSTSPASGIG